MTDQTRHPIVETIDRLHAALAHRCHRFYVENRLSKHRLSRMAQLSDTLLRGIDDPDFTASIRTLKRIDEVIPQAWEPEAPFLPRNELLDLSSYMLGRVEITGPQSESTKLVLKADAVHELHIEEYRASADYLKSRRGADGLLQGSAIDLDVLRTLAPSCKLHVIALGRDDVEQARFLRYDRSIGYLNGADLSGQRLKDLPDTALRSCLAADFSTLRDTDRPILAGITRDFTDGPNHRFLRWFVPFRATDGEKRILSIGRWTKFFI